MGAGVREARTQRILSTLTSSPRVICLNAPAGSETEIVAQQWASTQKLSRPWSAYRSVVEDFVQASGAEILATPDVSGTGAVILRCRQHIPEHAGLGEFLDATAGLSIAFISTISYNATATFFPRTDTTILLPETLFYTPEEVEEIIGTQGAQSDPWKATAGWPLAVAALQERAAAPHGQNQQTIREVALALRHWISGAPDLGSLITQLAFAPGFNHEVVYKLGDPEAGTLLSVHRMGLAVLSADHLVRDHTDWYNVPAMMAEALQTHFVATAPTRISELQRTALGALVKTGEVNLAMSYAMDIGDWETAEWILVNYWALASVHSASAFTQSLKRFFAKRPQGPYREFTDPEVAQLLSSSINVIGEGAGARYSIVPTYPLLGNVEGYHHNVSAHPVSPRAPFLDLIMRMQVKRMQGRWQAAAEVATLIEERLEVSEITREAQLKHQAEHGTLWYQVGFTRLMNADLNAATAAYRRAYRIATINGFTGLAEKCAGHLELVRACQGKRTTTAPAQSGLPGMGAAASTSLSLQVVHRVTAGFTALWDLDQQRLKAELDRGERQITDSELWPFQFFLTTMYELLFGSRAAAQRQILTQQRAHSSADPGVMGELLWTADAVWLLLHGAYAQVIEKVERSTSDFFGILGATKVVALLNRGDMHAALREIDRQVRAAETGSLLGTALLTLQAAATRIESKEPFVHDFAHITDDDGGLFNVLPLWFLGLPTEEIEQSFGLTPDQMRRVRSVFRLNTVVPRILPQLTEREQQIVRALAEGVSRKDLAAQLFVSMNTVKTHIAACYRKLGATSRHEALQEAAERGYL